MEEKEFPFEFSVVMAIYNVEPFLREAVDSLIAQDFGFERIQLIMVNDGSTDESGAICNAYAQQYPDNIIVIHKENGGVSSARNEGLKHIQGRYINFLDSDDKLKANAMSLVHKFFAAHEEETDVVAIPMFFFDGARGPHKQNNRKFGKGTRVINLIQDWKTVQLFCNSVFIKNEAATEICFDENLAYCEDGKEMQKLLLRKMTLGVVKNSAYLYRRRTQGELSAIQKAHSNIKWYMPYLKGVTESIIGICIDRLGYIPKFVQFSLMYDLQWRIKQERIPDGVMTENEKSSYKSLMFSLFSYFEDDVILAQEDIFIEYKAFVLKKKYKRDADILWRQNSAMLYYQNTCICNLNTNKTHFNFITLGQNAIILEGYTVLIAEDYQNMQIYLDVNGEKVPCTPVERGLDKIAMEEPILLSYGFQCTVPIEPEVEKYVISLFCEIDGQRVNKNKLIFGKYCPISYDFQNAYYCRNGYMLTADQRRIYLQRCGKRERKQRERLYLKELWKKKVTGSRKAVFARLLSAILKPLIRKKIWLISDRVNKADDNGEAFFRYVSERAPKEVNAYFAISPQSPDYERLKKFGKVIPFLGWRYKLLYLLADSVISSQGEEYIFHPFQRYSVLYRDLAQSQKFVFLQHGVTKDDVSGWLNRYNKNIAMFVTTTLPEYASILHYQYDYTPEVVKLTGFPRYDRLYHQEKKIITIMPTWRAYLVTGIDPKTGKRGLKPGYCTSQYFGMYDKLLNHQRLFDAAQKMGYTIAFLPHPGMTATLDMMVNDERLKLLGEETPYRTIFAESNLLVTDYSSVAFDFAYLRKPVLYYQTDKDEFFSGAHTYEKGYFDYEKDGFGEVEYSVEDLVEKIIKYMEHDCELRDEYRERINATFPFSDKNNCQRVYEAIMQLEDR